MPFQTSLPTYPIESTYTPRMCTKIHISNIPIPHLRICMQNPPEVNEKEINDYVDISTFSVHEANVRRDFWA